MSNSEQGQNAPVRDELAASSEGDDLLAQNKSQLSTAMTIWSWLFVGIAAIALVCSALLMLKYPASVNLLNIKSHTIFGVSGVILLNLFHVLMGIAAYSMLTGQAWGLKACKLITLVTMAIMIADMVFLLMNRYLHISLNLIVVIFYYTRLNSYTNFWRER